MVKACDENYQGRHPYKNTAVPPSPCLRIALQEDTNRMSANALAIVFAPCVLRCHDTIDPLLSVQDIGKTTAYVLLSHTNQS